MKIAIFNPYFGNWPYWIDLYMHSCKNNKEVDFYFFTDCGIPSGCSEIENLHFVSISFSDYCHLVSERLGIDFHPRDPYKLCDLKPFYGSIHEDILEKGNYAFWGFGDIDLVWGNIRAFYTDEVLNKADVFSTHADRVSGHLAIIRNTKYYRELCFDIPNWKTRLEDHQHFGLDEMDYTILLYGKKVWLFWKIHSLLIRLSTAAEWKIYSAFLKVANVLFCPRRLCFVERNTTPWPEDIRKKQVDFVYKDGRIYNCLTQKEVIYLHFLFLKKTWKKDCYCLADDFETASITVDGIKRP